MKKPNKDNNYYKNLEKEIDERQVRRKRDDQEEIINLLLERELLKIELQMIRKGRL